MDVVNAKKSQPDTAHARPAVNVLALNSGSSSLKFGLYAVDSSGTEMLLSGEAEATSGTTGRFRALDSQSLLLADDATPILEPKDAIGRIATILEQYGVPAPDAIGHRIVHGGPNLRRHCLIDERVLRQLESASAFAPLHVPAALSVVRLAQERFPRVPQAACLDTAFHAELPDVARVLPLPRDLQGEGIERYGFHGLSCESIMRQLGGDAPGRIVIAHLGNGASVTAVRDGKSIDTSMGLTPTGGVIMGTRSGDLDPGVLVYLLREKKLDAMMLEELVDRRSGLLGISGIGSDMRILHEAALSNKDAQLAIEMFCYSVRKQIAAMVAVLDGIDLLVFTGGIGENDAEARAAICAGLRWIGVKLESERNQSVDNPISDPASRCEVLVLPSREDEQIARATRALLRRDRSEPQSLAR
jgi:acetate kinase